MFPLEPDHFPVLLPPNLLLLVPLLGVDIRFHSPSEQTLILLKIADIDLILEQLLPPLHFEVEPLKVPCRIAIHSHEAIVLPLSHSHHTVQVPAFEEGIKEEVVLRLPVLPAEGPIGELHIIGCLDVVIREAKGFIIPCIIGVLISRAEVA